ncbi:hypothetical protein NDA15_000641 [Ustilago hordei]|nr:hypothetical protein NDA15_000641 [Ustilago hordei]
MKLSINQLYHAKAQTAGLESQGALQLQVYPSQTPTTTSPSHRCLRFSPETPPHRLLPLSPTSLFAKRAEEVVEEVVELDDDDDDDEDEDDPETNLEARARKHRHRKHHRSRKHRSSSSSSKSHRRSKHGKHHSSHSVSTSSSNNSGSFKGKGTFFKPNKGACGKRNTVNDYIVALSSDVYKGGKHCFGGVKVCYGGKCVSAKVADLCPGCHRTSLDMSPSLFKALADPDLGVIDISWSFT